jgi:hypothetical protein
MLRPLLLVVIFLTGLGSATAADTTVLKIISAEKTLAFTAVEFAALPRAEVKVADPRDKSVPIYAGVSMRELLTRSGAPLGQKLRGAALALGVLVRGRDHYAVLVSLAEFDENFSDRVIILADQEDGKPLPPLSAPLRIVTPGDKRGAHEARQVTSIEIVSLAHS